MVAKHLDLICRSFAVPAPVFEGVDDCQKFLIVDFVVDFRQLELPGVEGDRVQSPFLISLRQYGANGKVGGVCLNDHWFGGIEVGQYRCRRESLLQFSKGFFRLVVPFPLLFSPFR